MRLDDAGPRTWLLAAAAGWALASWLLAVAGMGGTVEPLADDPGLLQPLPPVRPSPPTRLGPLGQYDAIASRPLFAEDREPQSFYLQGEGEPAEEQAFDYVLTSVLITPQLEMAILQPREGGDSVRVRLDQAPRSHPGWRLVELDRRSAVFEGPDGPLTLQLRVYDGVGGERPTAVAPSRPAPSNRTRVPIIPPPAGTPEDAGSRPSSAAPAAEEAAPEEGANGEEAGFADEMTEQAQMDAIRERIQARREQLRNEQKPQPPVDRP